MLTLTYGVKKPETGDKGNVFCPALSANMQILNDHTHDGVTSAPISYSNITKPTEVTAPAAGWVASGTQYRQVVSCPGSYTYSQLRFECRIATGSTGAGNIVHPSIEPITANTFYIYTNDNTIGITVYFS